MAVYTATVAGLLYVLGATAVMTTFLVVGESCGPVAFCLLGCRPAPRLAQLTDACTPSTPCCAAWTLLWRHALSKNPYVRELAGLDSPPASPSRKARGKGKGKGH